VLHFFHFAYAGYRAEAWSEMTRGNARDGGAQGLPATVSPGMSASSTDGQVTKSSFPSDVLHTRPIHATPGNREERGSYRSSTETRRLWWCSRQGAWAQPAAFPTRSTADIDSRHRLPQSPPSSHRPLQRNMRHSMRKGSTHLPVMSIAVTGVTIRPLGKEAEQEYCGTPSTSPVYIKVDPS
jgi:hypothetical protein